MSVLALAFATLVTPAEARRSCAFCFDWCPSEEYGISLCNRECGEPTAGVEDCWVGSPENTCQFWFIHCRDSGDN
jgi:hypothetical protein